MSRTAWIALVWLFAVARAAAQPSPLPLELEWSAPTECPSATDVRNELERIARVRAGYVLRPLTADARVARKGISYRLTLQTTHEGRRGERQLEATDCRTLVRSLTLVLALAFGSGIELTAPAEEADASSLPAPFSPPVPVPVPVPDSPSPPSPPSPPLDLALSAVLSGTGTLNLFPSATFSAGAGLQLRWGPYALEARALFWPRNTSALTPAIDTHLHAVGGAVSVCRLDALSPAFGLTSCAGARLASLSAHTSGALDRANATGPWTALQAGAFLSWPRSHWLRLRLELGAALSLSRPRFVVESLGDAHRVPLFVPELGASVLARF